MFSSSNIYAQSNKPTVFKNGISSNTNIIDSSGNILLNLTPNVANGINKLDSNGYINTPLSPSTIVYGDGTSLNSKTLLDVLQQIDSNTNNIELITKTANNALPAKDGIRTGGSDSGTDISNAKLSGNMTGSQAASEISSNTKTLENDVVLKISGNSTNQKLFGASIDASSNLYGPTQTQITSSLLSTGIFLTPQMYGAIPDGSSDNTNSVQLAVNDICSRPKPGGILYFPPGNYRISTVKISCGGVYFIGSGIGNRDTNNGSIINSLKITTTPVLNFSYMSENYGFGGGIWGFVLKNDGLTTQPLIESDFNQQFSIQNIYSYGAYNLIKIKGGRAINISHLFAEALLPGGTGIELTGSGSTANSSANTRLDTPLLSDISLSAGSETGTTGTTHANGILIHGFVSTPQLIHVEMLNTHYGVRIDCGGADMTATELGACPQFVDMRDVEIDFADLYGIYAEDFQFLKCIGCYVHGGESMANGIKLANNKLMSYGAELLGGKIDSSQGSLVYSTVQGTHVTDMDLSSANIAGIGGAGVELQSDDSGSTNLNSIVSNNTMCLYHNSSPTDMTGINIGSTIVNVAMTGNIFNGCKKGIAYSGTATSIVQTGNVNP